MRLISKILLSASITVLTACGGGGGNPGGVASSTSSTTSPIAPVAADFIFQLDKSTIDDSGSDKALLSVTALDANRNTVSGVPVSVSVDSDGAFNRTGDISTDTNGLFSGNVTIGQNKSNRIINATITVGSISKVASVLVSGATLESTLVSATPAPNQSVTLTVNAKDKLGVAIPSTALKISGTAGLVVNDSTDTAGTLMRTFNAPTAAGSYTVVIEGLGVTTTRSLTVIDPTVSGIPLPVGNASSASLTPVPSTVAPNLPGSTANRVKLNAKFTNSSNTGVSNIRVRFDLVSPPLDGAETISTGTGTVYSDSSGAASADYIPGTRSSPTNGVVIKACYKYSDFSSTTECPYSATAVLTVASTPLSISISNDNKITSNGIAYIKQFLIQVNDSAGVAVKDAVVSLSVDITHYRKGFGIVNLALPSQNFKDVKKNKSEAYKEADPPTKVNFVQPATASDYSPSSTEKTYVWCINEDTNRNGSLDTGEDINESGSLEPRKAEIIVSYINGNRTDANGQLLAQISYGQNQATWLAYVLRATTGVDGSEGDQSKGYITTYLDADAATGSFRTPQYGVGSCTSKD